jgi:hypothetical protein
MIQHFLAIGLHLPEPLASLRLNPRSKEAIMIAIANSIENVLVLFAL